MKQIDFISPVLHHDGFFLKQAPLAINNTIKEGTSNFKDCSSTKSFKNEWTKQTIN